MKRKFLSLALCLMMVLSLIAVPTSAEGEVTLLESWFETADGTRVYDTSAAVTVKPAFYVNNETEAAITDAKLVLASYNEQGKLAVVNFAAAPEIATGESRIKLDESIAVSAGGETYMMIWDAAYAPVVPKTELTAVSRDPRITSFKIGDAEGYIKEENFYAKLASSTIYNEYSYEKSIYVFVPARSTVDLTADVTPVITIAEGATISPAAGTAVNFSEGPVTYTVTAPDGVTKQTYTVTAVKSDIRIYDATIGSDFPVIGYDDVNAETAVTSKSDYGTIGTTVTGEIYQGDAANTKWSTTNGSKAALYYTRAQIDGNKYVLRDNEQLEANDGNKVYYASSTATEPVTSGSEKTTDICYVLKDNGDGTSSKVLTCDYVVCADPENQENLVLRYDKRGAVNTNNNVYNKTFKYNQNSSNPANHNLNVLKYSFDLYVPKTNENALYMSIGLYSGNVTTVPGYYLCFRRTGNTLEFLARNKNTIAPVLHTINNGLDKWHDVDVLVTTDLTNKVSYLSLYIDNMFVATTNAKNTDASFQSKMVSGYDKHHMSFTTYGTEARGTFYIDNINIEAETEYVAK